MLLGSLNPPSRGTSPSPQPYLAVIDLVLGILGPAGSQGMDFRVPFHGDSRGSEGVPHPANPLSADTTSHSPHLLPCLKGRR